MDHDETGCQAPPEGPSLCINNCGFFGSKATMNMCSKCHKDMILKQEQAQFAASSIENLVNASPCIGKEVSAVFSVVDCRQPTAVETKSVSVETIYGSSTMESGKAKTEGPKRCSTCKKRVGLTGYNCRCGNLFCGAHRYSDKHNCPYDYRTTAQDAIARANPIVKAEKLDKI